jgi:hypothetical protein
MYILALAGGGLRSGQEHALKSKWNFLVAFVLAIVLLSTCQSPALLPNAKAQVQASRQVTIPLQVVFVGIDPATVDMNYLEWPGNLPPTTYSQVLLPLPNVTGVAYNIDYKFTFASSDYKSKLLSYLQTIQVMKVGQDPWFFYYAQEPSGYITQQFHSARYAVYDANKVENWIYSNQQDLGGFPSNGWTLMFLNLTELPSYDFKNYKDFLSNLRQAPPNGTAHYYGVQYTDQDLGYQLRNRDFMTGWGGVHRFWFDDFSAGPAYDTYPEELPLQIALKDNNYDLHSAFGKSWFTEYLATYIYQATENLITPPMLYAPFYSEQYSFDIHIFDNRTSAEKSVVDIKSTINSQTVKQAFEDLVPYSKIAVSVTFEDLSKHPDLQKVIDSNYKFADSFTAGVDFASPQQYGTADVGPVYKYFLDNMRTFEPSYRRDTSEYTIPVFVFALSSETTFTYYYKWLVEPFDGIALGDVAFVAFGQADLQRGARVDPPQPGRGLGFTHDVIHESGHMLGLPHPFDVGPVGNFMLSPMSYFTWDYTFGQADKDALRRSHVDQIYLEVQSMLAGISGSQADSIKSQLSDADSKYSQMDYVGALASVLKADDMAKAATPSTGNLAIVPATYLAVGVVIGFVVAWVVLRRRTRASLPFRVDRTLTQTTATVRFCPNCGSAAYPNNVYCHECGNRLPK